MSYHVLRDIPSDPRKTCARCQASECSRCLHPTTCDCPCLSMEVRTVAACGEPQITHDAGPCIQCWSEAAGPNP